MNIELALDVVATTSIVIGGILALLQLRHAQKQRTRELSLQMLRSFQTPEFLTAGNLVYELPEDLPKAQI